MMHPDEKPGTPVTAYVALGANLGDAAAALREALVRIGQIPGVRLAGASGLYRTEPIESSGPDYLNAVARVQTSLSARELLHALQAIENRLGRVRPAGVVNAPRTMDLDLLLYDDLVCSDEELVVPHPRMHLRAFVLVPLLQIAPDIEIPGKASARTYLPSVADQRIDGPL
jgi:2-amino-4-hydroxy-6-hydroxymethyldihydropteridine diphosphokinase